MKKKTTRKPDSKEVAHMREIIRLREQEIDSLKGENRTYRVGHDNMTRLCDEYHKKIISYKEAGDYQRKRANYFKDKLAKANEIIGVLMIQLKESQVMQIHIEPSLHAEPGYMTKEEKSPIRDAMNRTEEIIRSGGHTCRHEYPQKGLDVSGEFLTPIGERVRQLEEELVIQRNRKIAGLENRVSEIDDELVRLRRNGDRFNMPKLEQ